MAIINLITQNLVSPAVLFFILGIIAGFFKSDLEIPESISRYLSIYLMMAIGFKGGVAITNMNELSNSFLLTAAAGIAFSFLQPFLGYFLLRSTTTLDSRTAAAVAAHYGSVSIVTFVAATAFLKTNELSYAGYIIAVLALMEAPAILSGLFIAHKTSPKTCTHTKEEKRLAREIFTNGAILLLLGSFFIGWITGEKGMEKMDGFLSAPFQGILALFLLDMGLMVSKNLHYLSKFTLPLILFGIYTPIMGAIIGLVISNIIGLDIGTALLFMVLCASSSYIAVPAAMRLALPEAKISIYVPMSLAITFPFNMTFGIPLYYDLALRFLAHH